ncbi:DUF5723 family protein [Aureitalea marina]|uniref:DUF5723 domain-containing protein n=1 Tax=Aureitalea marina TaxID=930804 RepID=A0A2S7KQQ7_9FLAO|nr:DUF5723 family protein [Aureitalea marina]PQB04956.1 hypothetical protein BST85_08670 [Aureitalea marina]
MRILTVLLVALLINWASAQNKQLLYGFSEIPQSLLVNPGEETNLERHFGIPLFSQFHINGGSSGVTVYDIFRNDGGDINQRIGQKIFELSENDFFTATQQLEIISFGWRNRKEMYFSAGIYQELDFIAYFPRDLAILAWEGNQNYLDYPFDLEEVSAVADLVNVYHFGINKRVSKKWTLGARVKLYSGILNIKSTGNRGTFTTRVASGDSENIYEHTIENAEVTVNTSGVMDLDEGGASKIIGRAIFSGNLGLGLDLGASYNINDQVTASASLLDIGAIVYSRNNESYEARGSYTLDGIELLFPPLSEGEPAPPYWDDLEDELEAAIPIDTVSSAYTVWRPLKVNAAVSYGFGRLASGQECDCRNMDAGTKWKQEVGLQLFTIKRPNRFQGAATVYYYRRMWEFLSAKLTYTIDSYSYDNLGLGVSALFGRFNFYVMADNMLRYGNIAKAKSVSLQLGLNLKLDQQ